MVFTGQKTQLTVSKYWRNTKSTRQGIYPSFTCLCWNG